MSVLILDTATTGLWDWRADRADPRQPDMVRFSALLLDDEGGVADTASFIVRPPRAVTIDNAAAEKHRVTTDMLAEGMALRDAVARIRDMAGRARLVAAHSVDFHARVIDRSAECVAVAPFMPPRDRQFCTMRQSADVVQIRLQGNGQWKWPTLAEAYEHFAGTPLALPDDPTWRGSVTVAAVRLVYTRLSAVLDTAR